MELISENHVLGRSKTLIAYDGIIITTTLMNVSFPALSSVRGVSRREAFYELSHLQGRALPSLICPRLLGCVGTSQDRHIILFARLNLYRIWSVPWSFFERMH